MAVGWVKAHVAILGNEAADTDARRGAGMEEGTMVVPELSLRTVA